MTTPTDTDLAQALREMIDYYRGDRTEEPYVMGRARAALAAHESRAQPEITVTDEMVQRFLGWRLPDTFAPDCYVSFDREGIKKMGNGSHWPSGTNLFNDPEARAMLEHVLAVAPPPAQPASVADGWVPIDGRQPPRNTYAVYWHKSDHGGFPAIADEWRDEHHRAFATHWHPEASLGPQPPAKESE